MGTMSGHFVRNRADAAPVTLRQLIAASVLADRGEVVAGIDGLDRVVADVVTGALRGSSGPLAIPPSALAVLAGDSMRTDTYQVDMAVRAASESDAAGIVLCTERTNVVLAATRLANKLRVPVIVTESEDPITLADALRVIVREPRMLRSDVLLSLVTSLTRVSPNASVDDVLSRVSSELSVDLALVHTDGTSVAGHPDVQVEDRGAFLEVPTTTTASPWSLRAQPLNLARREPPTFWLVARMHQPTSAQESVVSDGLSIVSWFLGTRLVADRLERERDSRFRMGVLNSILAAQEGFDTALLQSLATLGWNVDGWCTAIHVQVSGEADSLRILALTETLTRSLADEDLSGPVIERSDGWSLWLTAQQEPQAASYRTVSEAVATAVESFIAMSPRLRLHAGIGRPYLGLDGLRTSLSEAREAATIAQASGGRTGVQHIDEMGVRRILLGWYASDSFAEFAVTLLGPLLAQDPDGTLLHTLEVYLDEESSATLAASRLGVHRNTILNRLERLRGLLTVDLDDPEERLAVQLACRVVKLKRAEQG
jgi:purine catabolism regulator